MRIVVPKFQSSRLNGVATIVITYIDTYIHTNILPNLGNTYKKNRGDSKQTIVLEILAKKTVTTS